MLILLTTKCHMACTHCMSDCSPTGQDMDTATYLQLLKFIDAVQPSFLNISGGEPTEHPCFFTWAEELIQSVTGFTILISNGSFILDPTKTAAMQQLLHTYPLTYLQVTTGKPYYRMTDDILAHRSDLLALGKYVEICEVDKDLFPLGRALQNHPSLLRKQGKPFCPNLFLLPKQQAVSTLPELIFFLEFNTKYNKCLPMIDPLGNIHCGESVHCQILGTIWDSPADLFEKLLHGVPCNTCGLVNNLPSNALQLLTKT